jgi:hypothetical protein
MLLPLLRRKSRTGTYLNELKKLGMSQTGTGTQWMDKEMGSGLIVSNRRDISYILCGTLTCLYYKASAILQTSAFFPLCVSR